MQSTAEQGIEQDARAKRIENMLNILKIRFPEADTDTLKPVFEAIDDPYYLEDLMIGAVLTLSLYAYLKKLDMIMPKACPRARARVFQGGALEEVMIQESPFYNLALARGREEGHTYAKQEAVLKILERRFGDLPQPLTTHIAETQHIPRLDAMFEEAFEVESLEELDWGSR